MVRWLARLVALTTALILVVPAGSLQAASARRTISGVVLLHGGLPTGQAVRGAVEGTCSGWSGRVPETGTGFTSDIVAGAPVVVRNARNKIIGKATLGRGTEANLVPSPGGGSTFDCNLPFRVKRLPKSRYYSVSVGQRMGVVFSRSDLKTNGWRVTITVRDSASSL